MTGRIAKLENNLMDAAARIVAMERETDRLRAEIARKDAALKKIANAPVPDMYFNGRGYVPNFEGFKPIARAALAPAQEKTDD